MNKNKRVEVIIIIIIIIIITTITSDTRSLPVTTKTTMSISSPNFSRNRRTVPEIVNIGTSLSRRFHVEAL